MYSEENAYRKEFYSLVNRLETKLQSQSAKIKELKDENNHLRTKLKEVHEGQTDIFSAITDKEQMVLKSRIQEFIDVIDHHLMELNNEK